MTAGGKRPGSGRPKIEKPLVTKCFRVDEDAFTKAQELHGKELNKKINAFIKRLAKSVGGSSPSAVKRSSAR